MRSSQRRLRVGYGTFYRLINCCFVVVPSANHVLPPVGSLEAPLVLALDGTVAFLVLVSHRTCVQVLRWWWMASIEKPWAVFFWSRGLGVMSRLCRIGTECREAVFIAQGVLFMPPV